MKKYIKIVLVTIWIAFAVSYAININNASKSLHNTTYLVHGQYMDGNTTYAPIDASIEGNYVSTHK